jgi:hypothetical protein
LANTLAAPVLFSRVLEYPLALAALAFLRPFDAAAGARKAIDFALPVAAAAIAGVVVFGQWPAMSPGIVAALAICLGLTWMRRGQATTLAAVASVCLLASPWSNLAREPQLHAERTFYGTYRVTMDPSGAYRSLKMGTTLHGMQSTDPARSGSPLTYYHRTGPFGRLFASVPRLREPGHVAAIGLGIGTLAAYVRPGQQWTFFEIDPAVERIARDERYFTFLKDCGDQCRVVLGDARLSLAARPGAQYQLIALDAFSSDAIPMHLLTQEAMQVYLSRLAPHGLLAFHISNRHLNLSPIVGRLAVNNGLALLMKRDRARPGQPWPNDKAQSTWVMMAREPRDFGALRADPGWGLPYVTRATPLWTDDFSNVFDVLDVGLF